MVAQYPHPRPFLPPYQYAAKKQQQQQQQQKKNWRWERPVNEVSAWSLRSLVPRPLLSSAAGGQKLGRWNGVISFPDFQSGSETRKEATIRVKINFAPLWITLAL